MPITDYQISRTARIYGDRHGAHAVAKARERAADLRPSMPIRRSF